MRHVGLSRDIDGRVQVVAPARVDRSVVSGLSIRDEVLPWVCPGGHLLAILVEPPRLDIVHQRLAALQGLLCQPRTGIPEITGEVQQGAGSGDCACGVPPQGLGRPAVAHAALKRRPRLGRRFRRGVAPLDHSASFDVLRFRVRRGLQELGHEQPPPHTPTAAGAPMAKAPFLGRTVTDVRHLGGETSISGTSQSVGHPSPPANPHVRCPQRARGHRATQTPKPSHEPASSDRGHHQHQRTAGRIRATGSTPRASGSSVTGCTCGSRSKVRGCPPVLHPWPCPSGCTRDIAAAPHDDTGTP